MGCIFFEQCEFFSTFSTACGHSRDKLTGFTNLYCNGPLMSVCRRRQAIFAEEGLEPEMAPNGLIFHCPKEDLEPEEEGGTEEIPEEVDEPDSGQLGEE